MKSMLKISLRYILSASGVALLLLVLNITVLLAWGYYTTAGSPASSHIAEIAGNLNPQPDGSYRLSAEGQAMLHEQYQWAMLLDESGTVVWETRLPADLPRQYSVADVASFTRWYLDDYPVYVWRRAEGLLVLARAPGTEWKHAIGMPESFFDHMGAWLSAALLLNIAAALLLALLFGLRLFRALRVLVGGIEGMALKKPLALPTRGLLGDLAAQLNQTAAELLRQDAALRKRDTARTTWIAGVSHDIRTPLSMTLGYASQLENNPQLPAEQREQAGIIRQQSEKIGALVNDLNLASKLEYDMQPLDLRPLHPGELARRVTAELLNHGLPEGFSLELDVEAAAEGAEIYADEALLRRALGNLIANSLRHNPDGCAVQLRVAVRSLDCILAVADNGVGYPAAVLERFAFPDEPAPLQHHGLGLTIVRQIVLAHHGALQIGNAPSHGAWTRLSIPLGVRGDR
ncbi:MAG: sensor histidine kinase [Chloroflexi bacterium]|nr:sensor histidine kinase [Chloroflexota bacterium]